MMPNKNSLFGSLKKIGNVFYDEVPEEEAKPAAPTPQLLPTAPASTLVGVDDATRKRLQNAMIENGLGSYDYLKFKSSLQDLANDIPDERLRYKTVFSTAKAMSVTKEKLVQTANHYLTVLDEESKKFNEAVNEETQASIIQAQDHVSSLDGTIAETNQKIAQLQAQVAELSNERIKVTGEITQSKSAIESSKARFTATYTAMVQEIKDDVTKLSNYLG